MKKLLHALPGFLLLVFGTVAIIFSSVHRFGVFSNPEKATIISSSALREVIDISELSAAEFKYRGIANVYTDSTLTKVRCRICYDAVIKASIDMQEVEFYVNTDTKTVIAVLPPIKIKATIIDEQNMSILPSNAKVRLDRMLKYSKEDAETEAKNNENLISTAMDNLQTTIEGLLLPILKPQGYILKWE